MNRPDWLVWDLEPNNLYENTNHRYKYTYGVKDIKINNKEYKNKSMYVSKKITVDGSIGSVSLIANDINIKKHDSFGINPYETSIEYYITFDDYEWIPILPSKESKVECELLMFKNDSSSTITRFPIDPKKPVSLYRNGIKLDGQFYRKDINEFFVDNSTSSTSYKEIGDKITITKAYDKYSIYTISYSPDLLRCSPYNIDISDDKYKLVDFVGEDGKDGELFKYGTDRNGSITLSKYPYIDNEKIILNKVIENHDDKYKPISVNLESANIAIYGGKVETYIDEYHSLPSNAVKVLNVTNYLEQSENQEKILNKYDLTYENGMMRYPYIEYLHIDNKLYFPETFNNTSVISNAEINHGDAHIRVNYKYLDTHVRLKAILRNISNSNYVTPMIKDYQLIFNLRK